MRFPSSRVSLVLARRLFVTTTAAYLSTSLCRGGTLHAETLFYTLAIALGGSVLGLSVSRLRLAAPILRAGRAAEVAGFNLALGLVALECLLRAHVALGGGSVLLSGALEAHRLVPGKDYGAGLRGNALGYPGRDFRTEKRSGVYRITALGDSFAVGPTVPYTDNFLEVVEKRLAGTEVYNFGVSSAGPREYLQILKQHALPFHPDLVLVCVFVGNDITESLATPRHLDPRRWAVYTLATRGPRLLQERARQGGSADDRLAGVGMALETFHEIEARRLAVCLRAVPEDVEKKWTRGTGYLDQVVNTCRTADVPVAVVLIPDEFQVNPAVFAAAAGAAGRPLQDFDLELPQRRLVEFFRSRNVPCLDLLPTFRGVADTYTPRDTHWNVAGNHLAGEAITAWLARTVRPGVTWSASSPPPPAP